VLGPFDELDHFTAIHVLQGNRNRQQTQDELRQQDGTDDAEHAAGAAAVDRDHLLGLDADADAMPELQRHQQAADVAEENAEYADVEQVAAPAHRRDTHRFTASVGRTSNSSH
jgi:hypothetical protein